MLVSTLVPAVVVAVFIYFLASRLRWQWLSYGLTIVAASTLIYAGSVHLVFTGIEVVGVGCLATWLDPLGAWKKKGDSEHQKS
ncbi:hypothetical protein [Acidisphaera sp. L21]|uniref:hypothetical protein n=1 Tax=Acidisphaera sp. L21 TaxID=1641851 RepID=UPI00131B912B|nr:hypothetical protein [Acidisphaera sp. L21]